MTLRHLLTMTSGLFTHRDYSSGRISEFHCSKEMHRSEDPISEFFRIVIVRSFFYFHAENYTKSFFQGKLPALPLQFEPGTDCKSLSFIFGDISQPSLPCEQSATAGVQMLWDSLWKGYQGKPWSNSGSGVPFMIFIYWLNTNSKENIFDPLGMKSSFFLTPDLKERAVDLAYRDANGTLHPWDNQIEIIEQDPTKGMQKKIIFKCWSFLGYAVWSLPWPVRILLGAIGLYSSMRDYLKLLRHLMQIHGELQSMSFFYWLTKLSCSWSACLQRYFESRNCTRYLRTGITGERGQIAFGTYQDWKFMEYRSCCTCHRFPRSSSERFRWM